MAVAASHQQLLTKIEDSALDNRAEEALRLCLQLDPMSPFVDLRNWALKELSGYGDDDDLPGYRVIKGRLRADWTNGFTTTRKQDLSSTLLPQEVRHLVPPDIEFRDAIGVAAAKSTEGSVALTTEAMQIATTRLNQRDEYGFQLQRLYWTVSGTEFQTVCSSVCTSLLDKLAPLKSAAASALAENETAPEDQPGRSAHNIHIHGSHNTVTNVAHGEQSAVHVTAVGSAEGNVSSRGIRQRLSTATSRWVVRVSIVLTVSAAIAVYLWQFD